MNIGHILVVVDPSVPGQQAAVDKAALLARGLGACVELLICDIAAASADRIIPIHAHKAITSDRDTLKRLEALAAPLREQGIEVRLRTIYGKSLHDSLLDYIRGSNADLVVKDMHPHSFAKRVLLRNTDWYLTRGCPVPLLLTKTNAWARPPVVMAAVDARANARVAALHSDILNWAAKFAGGLTGSLHVIHTFIPTAFAAVVAAGQVRMSPEYSQSLQLENQYIAHQLEQLVHCYGVRQEHVHVEMGTIEDSLTRAVTKYGTDVMVIGASSHSRWHRMVAGSTTVTLFEAMPCDILIVRPFDDAQAM